jgi:membrane protease YdiL (CAAX protease family)
MHLIAHEQLSAPPWLGSVVLLLIAASLGTWLWMAKRLSARKPVLPYQPRRQVPWRAVHLLLVLVIYLAAQMGMPSLVCGLLGVRPPELTSAQHNSDTQQMTTEHMVAQLLAEKDVWVLLLCMLAAAVIAPLAEEFFFRVLLQGWLEAAERRRRRRSGALLRLLPVGVGPIVLSSLLFAGLHFRQQQPAMPARWIICLLVANALANLLTMACAILLLRTFTHATAADFGWVPAKFGRDVALGLLAVAAAVVPVYGIQIALPHLLPRRIAPDPFALFLFALVLGSLYGRTHRLLPSVVTHATFNAAGLLLAWSTMAPAGI